MTGEPAIELGRIVTIEDFEGAIRALVLAYVRTLSLNAPRVLDSIRFEARGAGVSVTYDKATEQNAPVLVVSLTPTNPGRRS